MILAKEWEVARELIAQADERIDALRKYGFSFVASLLTADTIALHSLKDGDAKATPGIAVGVSVVASVLVVAMRLLEKNTQLLQLAAVQRAQVIERHLGAELSEIVVERHRAQRWGWMGDALYCVFAVLVAVVGGLAGGSATGFHDICVRSALLAAVAVICCALIVTISLIESASRARQKDDWSLDRLECVQGETIRIMLTRWGKTTEALVVGKVVWRIDHLTEAGAATIASRKATARDCDDDDCKVWLWGTTGRAPGLYEVVIDPDNVRNSKGTLRRRIRVVPAPAAAPSSEP